MKSKITLVTATAMSFLLAGCGQPKQSRPLALTYTVNVGHDLWTHTNVVEIRQCTDTCTIIRYVEDNTTNDFHAFAVSVKVETNAPAKRLFSAPTDPKDDTEIKDIKWRHKLNCDLSRASIQAGYLACSRGMSLSNYLADLDREWDKLLADQIAEAKERDP